MTKRELQAEVERLSEIIRQNAAERANWRRDTADAIAAWMERGSPTTWEGAPIVDGLAVEVMTVQDMRAEIERLTAELAAEREAKEAAELSASMACEAPPDDCECGGCWLAAKTGGTGILPDGEG